MEAGAFAAAARICEILLSSRLSERRRNALARIGYTAKYAAWVHGMPNDVNWTTPGTGNKFLEKAIRRNTREILGIIRANAKVK